jgi:hypothetical protein
VETAVTVCINRGTGRFLHPRAQSDQDNVISGCRLALAAVVDCAGDGLTRERHGQQEEYARNEKGRASLVTPKSMESLKPSFLFGSRVREA